MSLNSLGKLLIQASVFLPGERCHVIQRGNDRNPCFFDVRDVRKAFAFAVPSEGSRVKAYIVIQGTVYPLEPPWTVFPLAANRCIDHIIYKEIGNDQDGACSNSKLSIAIVTQRGNRRRNALD